jgi:hypothetical protein
VNPESYYKTAAIANHKSYYTTYLLALFIVELQTAKRRLSTIFEEAGGPSKDRTRNAANLQRAEIELLKQRLRPLRQEKAGAPS